MKITPRHSHALVASVLCLAPSFGSAAEAGDIAELRRSLETLRAENRALAARLATLEAQRPAPVAADVAAATVSSPATPVGARETQRLEQRVKELELAKVVQEDAVRSIIRDSVSTLGSKINESVSLSGSLGVTLGRSSDFSGERKSSISLSAADFEFEIQTNDWTRGVIKIEHNDGRDVLFPTTTGGQAGVDRIVLDTAYITIGDTARFPALLTAGRIVLPFGISTGHPVADVLSITSPLTVEAFEMRQNAVSFSLAFPTRALGPATPPVVAPPVRPLLLGPLVESASRGLGYRPLPTRLKPLAPVNFAVEPPPFTAGVYLFDGGATSGLRKQFGGQLGYQAKGHCGRRYEELTGIGVCPWSASVDLGYNSSVFSSRFLETEYAAFLGQIGRVPGVSASVKASLGPFAVVGEWNGAMRRAQFNDDAAVPQSIKPRAWQVSLGYQFDWNPWVQEIGAQGSYVSLGYSQSRDLAGATRLIAGEATRVGFVPKRRIILTAGEWVLDGLRWVVEYSHNQDYSPAEGGTGRSASGLFTTLTYVW